MPLVCGALIGTLHPDVHARRTCRMCIASGLLQIEIPSLPLACHAESNVMFCHFRMLAMPEPILPFIRSMHVALLGIADANNAKLSCLTVSM